MRKANNKQLKRTVFLFVLPALFIYIAFQIIPLFGAMGFSLVSWNGIAGSKITFVGLQNYIDAFKNPAFILSLKNLLRFTVLSVLIHTPIALLLAVALNAKIKGYRFFKALFFVPTVFPLTAIGLMWYFIFMPAGAFNAFLEAVGLGQLAQSWLVNAGTAMNTITFVNIWAGVGYYMVILLAGLTTLPTDVYEAAKIDGATSVQAFFHITVPLLKPTISMCFLMDIIGTVKVFDLIFAMTGGGPNGLTNLPTTLMYNEAFKYSHYGMGSAIGMIILIICLVGTLTVNGIMGRKSKED